MPNTTVLHGDVAGQVADLKERYNEISIWGSSQLITTLLQHDLIDEFVLLIYPTVVGGGKQLFNGDTALNLKLVESATSGTGVAIHTYRRDEAGDKRTALSPLPVAGSG